MSDELNMDTLTSALQAEGFRPWLLHTGGGNYSLVVPTHLGDIWVGPYHANRIPCDTDPNGDPIVYVGFEDYEVQAPFDVQAYSVEDVLDGVAMLCTEDAQ